MPMMIANRRFAYAGTFVEAGERFEARAPMARVLATLGRAAPAVAPPAAAPVNMAAAPAASRPVGAGGDQGASAAAGSGPPPAEGGDSELDALRRQYEGLMGRKPSPRWRASRLRQEIEGTYSRRDMRAAE